MKVSDQSFIIVGRCVCGGVGGGGVRRYISLWFTKMFYDPPPSHAPPPPQFHVSSDFLIPLDRLQKMYDTIPPSPRRPASTHQPPATVLAHRQLFTHIPYHFVADWPPLNLYKTQQTFFNLFICLQISIKQGWEGVDRGEGA